MYQQQQKKQSEKKLGFYPGLTYVGIIYYTKCRIDLAALPSSRIFSALQFRRASRDFHGEGGEGEHDRTTPAAPLYFGKFPLSRTSIVAEQCGGVTSLIPAPTIAGASGKALWAGLASFTVTWVGSA